MHRHITGLAIVLVLLIPQTADGQSWDELENGHRDVGNTIASAQDLSTIPVTLISGALTEGDVDVFQLNIVRPSRFSATTVKPFYYSGDIQCTQLSLYNATGDLVFASTNGQLPIGSFLSLLSGASSVIGGLTPGPTVPGTYYLAVAAGTSDDSKASTGRYEITLTGVALSVALESFTVTTADNAALVQWATAAESGNAGFDIEVAGAGETFRSLGFVPGYGTTKARNAYRFVVDSLTYGAQTFRLRNLNYDGTSQYSPAIEVSFAPMHSDIFSATDDGPVPIRGLAMVRTRQLVAGAIPQAASAR